MQWKSERERIHIARARARAREKKEWRKENIYKPYRLVTVISISLDLYFRLLHNSQCMCYSSFSNVCNHNKTPLRMKHCTFNTHKQFNATLKLIGCFGFETHTTFYRAHTGASARTRNLSLYLLFIYRLIPYLVNEIDLRIEYVCVHCVQTWFYYYLVSVSPFFPSISFHFVSFLFFCAAVSALLNMCCTSIEWILRGYWQSLFNIESRMVVVDSIVRQ